MHLQFKNFATILLLIGGISGTPALIAQTTDLTLSLIDARLESLRISGTARTDEKIQAYEAVRNRLIDAESFNRDTARYVDLLSSAPRRQAEIQARIDDFDDNETTPEEVAGLSREELESRITLVRRELQDSENALDTYERRLAARETQTDLLRTRLREISQRLGEIDKTELSVDPHAIPSVTEALQWGAAAEYRALVAERRANKSQLDSQPVRYGVLQAERAEMTRRIDSVVGQVRALQKGLRQRLSDEAEPDDVGIDDDNPVYAIADAMVMENARLRTQRLDIEELVDSVNAQEDAVTRSKRELGERFATARRMVDFASESDALGAILLAYWEGIDSYRHADPTIQLSRHVGDTVISRIDHEEALLDSANVSGYISGRIRDAGLDPATIAEVSNDVLVELARSRREQLQRIIEVESAYIFALSELEANHSQLTTTIEEYEEYLGVLILWKPSRQRLWKLNPRALPDEIRDVMGKLRESRTTIAPTFVALLLFASVLFITRRRMWEAQLVQNSRILRPRSDSLRFTFVALFLTGLRALPATLLILAIGTQFSQENTSTSASLTTAIDFLAVVLFTLIFTHTLCDENGVARAHFGWRSNACDQWLEDASWLIRWWLPIAALAAVVFMLADDTAAVGRLMLLLAIGVLIGHLVSNIRRGMRVSEWRWSIDTANRLRLMFVAILILLAAGVFWGLRYSVGIITSSLLTTVCIGVGLLLVHSLLMRWLRVVNRRLRFAELRSARSKKATGEIDTIEEDKVGLLEISEATTRLLHVVTMVATVVATLYIWAPLLPAFDLLSEVTLWTSSSVVEGESMVTRITLETLVVVIFLVSVTLAAVRNLPALVELVLRSRTNMTAGGRYTTSTLMSYVIIGVGIVSALSALGLQWSKLQWLIAALGIGIGFGLQEIVADFISGLIILFERPIRVGDIVTVGDNVGEVSKIRIRATTIRDRDGKELLVPNKEFTTGHLLNWSLSDTHMRISIPVGVAYGSDVEQALKMLGDIVADHPSVLKEPEPRVIFENFGDNALELSARCFLGEYRGWQEIATKLRREIYKRFTEAGIVIAFPQRDVHFDTEQPIRIVVDPPLTN